MVRSGLREAENQHDAPRVSPYRLATHLTSAFAIYVGLLWTTLSLAYPQPGLSVATGAQQAGGALLRARLMPLSALIGVTAVSGAQLCKHAPNRVVRGLHCVALPAVPNVGRRMIEVVKSSPTWRMQAHLWRGCRQGMHTTRSL